MTKTATPVDYFMLARVKGHIHENKLQNRISEVTVQFYDRIANDGSVGPIGHECLCSIAYNYDAAEYTARASLKLTDEQFQMMTAAYGPSAIQSEGIDMAAEYLSEYAPNNPVDVNEYGLLVYAGDVDLS